MKGEISVHSSVVPVFKLHRPSGPLRVISAGMDDVIKLGVLVEGTVLQKLGMCLPHLKSCDCSLAFAPNHFDLLLRLHDNFLLYHDTDLRSLAGRRLL